MLGGGGTPSAQLKRESSPFQGVKLRNISPNSTTKGEPKQPSTAGEGSKTSPFGNIKLRSTGVVIDRPQPQAAQEQQPKSPRQAASPTKAPPPSVVSADKAQSRPAASNYKDPDTTKFSYAQLKARDPDVEADVDPIRRPLYLSETEMKEVMGVTRQEYLGMKPWKQSELRKKFGLF